MKVVNTYSFKNGENYIKEHYPQELKDVLGAIGEIDASSCMTKESKEKTMKGELLFSPRDLNDKLKTKRRKMPNHVMLLGKGGFVKWTGLRIKLGLKYNLANMPLWVMTFSQK
jgi:hypothetical protein